MCIRDSVVVVGRASSAARSRRAPRRATSRAPSPGACRSTRAHCLLNTFLGRCAMQGRLMLLGALRGA
eukprot:4863077-Lingulodinium_polyedra.AAC.1